MFRLKDLRERRRLSQVTLAMDLNLNQNSISRYETGEREADYTTLIAIADYFGVSVDYLLGRTDNPRINRKKSIHQSLADAFFLDSRNSFSYYMN